MQILKISHGKEYFSEYEYDRLIKKQLVCIHSDTNGKGRSAITQYEHFRNAKKGDLFFLCLSNERIDVIGMFIDERPLVDPRDLKWIYRKYDLLLRASDDQAYDKSGSKWWLPGDNSTCVIIPEYEYGLFEEKILKPVFNKSIEKLKELRNKNSMKNIMTMEDILKLQLEFKKYFRDDSYFLDKLNSISKEDKERLIFEYNEVKNIERQPVVFCRKRIVEILLEKEISDEDIRQTKQEIGSLFSRNVFKSWKSNVRLLYPLIYSKDKEELVSTLREFIYQLQTDLDLVEKTKIKVVHLDGAQNQGHDVIWCAIYNNSHKTQKTAKQLFFKIDGAFEFGLLDYMSPDDRNIIKNENFSYNEIKTHMMKFVNEILKDEQNISSDMNELLDLVLYKKQIILQGPPGTGKTKQAELIAKGLIGLSEYEELNRNPQFKLVQFHPSYTYEDFVRGIVAIPNQGGNSVLYETQNKVLADFAQAALDDQENNYVLVIDEINRANLSSVLGELIYALEYRDKGVNSMYNIDGEDLVLPHNLYIIGTMNTADRSVGHIDYAIRRRFAFVDVLPKNLKITEEREDFNEDVFATVASLFVKGYDSSIDYSDEMIVIEKSEYMTSDFEPKDVWLGHSYFMEHYEKDENGEDITDKSIDFNLRIKYEIKPILLEYIKDGILKDTGRELIEKLSKPISNA